MSNKFLQSSIGNVTDGSVDIFGSSIGAANLQPGYPVKINSNSRLETQLLEISDTSGLQAALNSTIQNPVQANVNMNQYALTNANNVEIKTGGNTAKLVYTGVVDQVIDVSIFTADVAFTGTPPVVVGEVVAFNSTNGKNIKETGVLSSNLAQTTGMTMTGDIVMGANNITLAGGGLVDGVDVSTLPASISAKLPLAGGTMSGVLNMGGQNITNGNLINAVEYDLFSGTKIKSSDPTRIDLETSAGTLYGFQDTKMYANRPVTLSDGTAGAPAVAFIADTATGIYRNVGTGKLGVCGGGVEQITVDNTKVTMHTVSMPSGGDSITLLNGKITAPDALNVCFQWPSGIGTIFCFNNSEIRTFVPVKTSDGTAALPSHTFFSDQNTGMYSTAADTIGFSTGGVQRLTIANAEVKLNNALNMNGGNVNGANLINGFSGTILGMDQTNIFTFSTGGTERVRIQNSATTISNPLKVDNIYADGAGPITIGGDGATSEVVIGQAGTDYALPILRGNDQDILVSDNVGTVTWQPVGCRAFIEGKNENILNSYNVASVSVVSVGQFTVTFTNAFPDEFYTVNITPMDQGFAMVASFTNFSTTSCDVVFRETVLSTLTDPVFWSASFFHT